MSYLLALLKLQLASFPINSCEFLHYPQSIPVFFSICRLLRPASILFTLTLGDFERLGGILLYVASPNSSYRYSFWEGFPLNMQHTYY